MLINKEEIELIASVSGNSEEDTARVLTHFWSHLKNSLRHSEMPIIRVTDFGVFMPSRNYVRKIIHSYIRRLKEDRENDKLKSELRRFWNVKNELAKIKNAYGRKQKAEDND